MWVKSESLAPPAFLNSRETREPPPLASKSVRKRRAIIDYPSTALTRSCLLHGLEFSDSFGVFLTRRRHFGLTVFPFVFGQLNSMENAKLNNSLHKNH